MKATVGNLTSTTDFDPQAFRCSGLQHYSDGPFIVATVDTGPIERLIVGYSRRVLVRLHSYFIRLKASLIGPAGAIYRSSKRCNF